MKKALIKPLAILAMAGMFYSCEKEEVMEADLTAASINAKKKSPGQDTGNSSALICDEITFDDYQPGYVSSVTSEKGKTVSIKGIVRHKDTGDYLTDGFNYAAILDSENTEEADMTSHKYPLGKVLIANDYKYKNITNTMTEVTTNPWGATTELDFSSIGTVTVRSFNIIDIEDYEENSRVEMIGADGRVIFTQNLPVTDKFYPGGSDGIANGEGGIALVTFGTEGVSGVAKLRVIYEGTREGIPSGSGGVDNIVFCYQNPSETVGECEGKVSSITLQYTGDETVRINATVKAGKKQYPESTDPIEPGLDFTFSSETVVDDSRGGFAGTLGTELMLEAYSEETGKLLNRVMIHTSCSQPIYTSYGSFTVVKAYSKHGGLIPLVTR